MSRQEDRPRLLTVLESDDILVERLHFRQSPYWTFLASGVTNLEVRYSRVDNRRTHADRHDLLDLTAFNTDGSPGRESNSLSSTRFQSLPTSLPRGMRLAS